MCFVANVLVVCGIAAYYLYQVQIRRFIQLSSRCVCVCACACASVRVFMRESERESVRILNMSVCVHACLRVHLCAPNGMKSDKDPIV